MIHKAIVAGLLALIVLAPAANASHRPNCGDDTIINRYSSTYGGFVTEVWQYKRVLVPGYFAYRTVIVGYEFDYLGNSYPVTRTDRVWVPGYWDCQWILVNRY